MKPAPLIQHWLSLPGIELQTLVDVHSVRSQDDRWLLQNSQAEELGAFELVVLANAMGSKKLLKSMGISTPLTADVLEKFSDMRAVHGTLSYGAYAEDLPDVPAVPVNGHGCFIPHVPLDGHDHWVAGSTFETDVSAAADLGSQHALNMERLARLLPGTGAELAQSLDRGPKVQWTATRCVTHDRLPLVGPVDTSTGAGLWICAGMGSRGLSFAPLCAELLAAHLFHEPLPMEFSLSRRLDVSRPRRKRQHQQSPVVG
jgi:tRNA 5-methylaminomethyl-2-thiouridine biosynthesis bifunctional protein